MKKSGGAFFVTVGVWGGCVRGGVGKKFLWTFMRWVYRGVRWVLEYRGWVLGGF